MFRPLVLLAFLPALLPAADFPVSSAADIARLSPTLRPGDTLILQAGEWTDQAIVFQAHGAAEQPITLRAAVPGGVVLRGKSSLLVQGGHLAVSGLQFREGTTTGDAIALHGDDLLLDSCSVRGGLYRRFLHMDGLRQTVERCDFTGKTTEAPTLQVEVGETPNEHRIVHNYFGARPPLGRNGGETMRIGYSGQAKRLSRTRVEGNLFENCDGELEVISNKSCGNVYRGNLFLHCAGTLTLRHGNDCTVEDNQFLGGHKRGSGGIRVIGSGHTIVRNRIEDVAMGGIWLTCGIPDAPPTGYEAARDCRIENNRIVDPGGPCLWLDAGMGTSGRTLSPERIAIVGNLFSPSAGAPLLRGAEGQDFEWRDNLTPSTEKTHSGIATIAAGQPPVVARPQPMPDTASTGPAWLIRPGASAFAYVAARDRERILKAANAALTMEPVSITSHRAPLSEGGPHDFYSNGDYWWPDPKRPDGLPYIKRDGESNPANFSSHRLAVRDLRDAVAALAAAWRITGDERYPEKAARLLQVFFLDPETRMNPNLEYAQAIPGVSPGRGIGIIDALHLAEIPRAVRAMEGSRSFPAAVHDGLRTWFGALSRWMQDSKNGKEEAATRNNHSVAYFLQLASFAEFCGDEETLALCRRRYRESFVPDQMAADGSFPRELERTKPYAYSIFQLDNMAALCQVLSTPQEDLWSFQTADGRGIRRATAWLFPYLADKPKWLRAPDVQAWEGWPVRQPALLFTGIATGEGRYLDLWQRLPADPTDAEVRRNMAITQPLLWLR